MNIKILAFIWIFGLCACSAPKNLSTEKVAGAYIQYSGSNNTTLDLYKSGVYKYQTFTGSGGFGILFEESYGKWLLDSGSISLNSYQEWDTTWKAYEVLDVEYSQDDTLAVEILDSCDIPIIFVNCVVFRKDTVVAGASTDFEGKARIDVSRGDRLEFSNTGMSTAAIPLETKKPTNMVLRIYNSQWPEYRYFSNTRWNFKGRKLVDPKTGLYFHKKWPTPTYHYE
ncbi:hypothetical protein [Owenweeksia hongkongensis]|uniref:hypothetical protein n=1 Tax=Owenweeksia hongkongensis TaxID=253245 RepID=UPI003A8FE236